MIRSSELIRSPEVRRTPGRPFVRSCASTEVRVTKTKAVRASLLPAAVPGGVVLQSLLTSNHVRGRVTARPATLQPPAENRRSGSEILLKYERGISLRGRGLRVAMVHPPGLLRWTRLSASRVSARTLVLGLKVAAARPRPRPYGSSRVTPSRRPPGSSGTRISPRLVNDPVQGVGARAVGGSRTPDLGEDADQGVLCLVHGGMPGSQEREEQRRDEVVQLGQGLRAAVGDQHQQVVSPRCCSSRYHARIIRRATNILIPLPCPSFRFLHTSHLIGASAAAWARYRMALPTRRPASTSLPGVASEL